VTGRSPARLLAPLALVVVAVALYAVVNSGVGDSTDDSGDATRPAATATANPKSKSKKATAKAKAKTYTVQPGDTPSSIAQKTGVELGELLDANPEADPNALSPGQKLKLP
jgi:LysM repeat protein